MRVLILGCTGQIGWQLQRSLAALGQVVPMGRAELDLEQLDRIPTAVRGVEPDLIVNAAAYTAVDSAEREADLAWKINAAAPGVLAVAARERRIPLIHFSSDYVFDGAARESYDEDDPTGPVNEYGRSKLGGERAIRESGAAHLVLRTSWVYGNRGPNFLNTVARLLTREEPMRVVDDQVGAPTWSRMLAEAVTAIVARTVSPAGRGQAAADSEAWGRISGVYHLTAAGRTTWHGFAEAIRRRLESLGSSTIRARAIERITTEEYAAQAARPLNSILSNEKIARTFGVVLPSWEDQLDLCLDERCARVEPR